MGKSASQKAIGTFLLTGVCALVVSGVFTGLGLALLASTDPKPGGWALVVAGSLGSLGGLYAFGVAVIGRGVELGLRAASEE